MSDERLTDDEQLLKDRSYSPSSDRETEALQRDPERPDAEVEAGDRVRALPGTGGPDDEGDVEVSAEEVDLPRDEGAH